MSILEGFISDCIESDNSLNLTEIGEKILLEETEQLKDSRFFPEIIVLFGQAWAQSARQKTITERITSGLESIKDPITFDSALDVLFEQPMLSVMASEIQETMLKRAQKRSTNLEALCASAAIKNSLRLVLKGCVTRFALLDFLCSISKEEHEDFATRMARIIGIALEQWPDTYNDLQPKLKLIAEIEGAEAEGAFELGMVHLRLSLQQSTGESVCEELKNARRWFNWTTQVVENRDDAVAYGSLIDILLSYFHKQPAPVLLESYTALEHAIQQRALWLYGRTIPSWLKPRQEAEIMWLGLAHKLQSTSEHLEQSSWLHAPQVLEQVLAVYRTSRSFLLTDSQGLKKIIGPRIESSFVQRQGLLAHLEDWLEEYVEHDLKEEAKCLRDLIRKRLEEGFATEKFEAVTNENALVAALGTEFRVELSKVSSSLRHRLENFFKDKQACSQLTNSPVLNDILEMIQNSLEPCSDYQGRVRETFNELLLLTLRFVDDRSNRTRSSLGRRGSYLFSWDEGDPPPAEAQLQQDYYDWLSGNRPGRVTDMERSDIGSGRVDVLIQYETHRFVAELKRELADASSSSLATYLGQTIAYQSTDVCLSLLLVLDLTDKSSGIPHIRQNVWCEILQTTLPRYVVVFRVPGNRIPPSATTTPVFNIN